MNNFTLHNSTEVIFGKDVEQGVGEKLKALGGSRVLVHFGGASAKKSGLLDRIEKSLIDAGLTYVELGGVSPNPKLSLALEGMALVEREGVDFILAVGGGSVIDSAKGIALGAANKRNPWDFASGKAAPEKVMPLATVLTIAAAGSETSTSCVLTNEEIKEKRGITSQLNRPLVSFMNPELTYSVSPFQTGCGIVDIMMHTMERYLVNNGGEAELTDRIAEGLLVSVMQAGRRALENPNDYEARATLMWAGSLSHNDLTGCGRARLFPAHKLEHEVSALHDEVAHAAGLSVIFPAWAMYVMEHDVQRFAQLANRVLGVPMDFACPARTAKQGIETLKRFYEEIDMPTSMSEIGIAPHEYGILADNAIKTVGKPVASYVPLDRDAIIKIFEMAE